MDYYELKQTCLSRNIIKSIARISPNFMKNFCIKFLFIITLLALIPKCDNNGIDLNKQKPFIIAVVGEGADTNTIDINLINNEGLNREQGRAMLDGVFTAYKVLSKKNKINEIIELITFDDRGAADSIKNIAINIIKNPRILAVIGHSSSGTTKIAANIYSLAGIPLLMPIATCPYVNYEGEIKKENERYINCYRLPPVDDLVQARAVAYVAKIYLNAERVFLIRDTSKNATTYSKPIFDVLYETLYNKFKILQKDHSCYICKENFIETALEKISYFDNDLVIFCGYKTTAELVLSALNKIYKQNNKKKPIILLTDGCKNDDLKSKGFTVYITFPLPPLDTLMKKRDLSELSNKIKLRPRSESYQIYGYDAMIILGHIINNCKKEKSLSRKTILEKLEDPNGFHWFDGTCFDYKFIKGENLSSDYYLYLIKTDKKGKEYPIKLIKKINGDTLNYFWSN